MLPNDDRFKVLPEYGRTRAEGITGWIISRNNKELGFYYEHSRAMTSAQRMARKVCPVQHLNTPTEEKESQ